MYFEIDLSTVPPAVTLHDTDDFTGFKVVAQQVEHTYVGVDALKELAGARAEDPAWLESLEKMIAYAREHGWVRSDGAVRAHVEWRT